MTKRYRNYEPRVGDIIRPTMPKLDEYENRNDLTVEWVRVNGNQVICGGLFVTAITVDGKHTPNPHYGVLTDFGYGAGWRIVQRAPERSYHENDPTAVEYSETELDDVLERICAQMRESGFNTASGADEIAAIAEAGRRLRVLGQMFEDTHTAVVEAQSMLPLDWRSDG